MIIRQIEEVLIMMDYATRVATPIQKRDVSATLPDVSKSLDKSPFVKGSSVHTIRNSRRSHSFHISSKVSRKLIGILENTLKFTS